jgi:PhoH-like ATPase
MTDSKIYALDTNVLIHDPNALFNFEEHEVLIPMVVLEELDKLKVGVTPLAVDCRQAVRTIDRLIGTASPQEVVKGVPIVHADGNIEGRLAILMPQLDGTTPLGNNDDRIIHELLALQSKYPARKVVLVTKDINMRLRAKGAGVRFVEDYRTDQLIDDVQYLTKGFQTRTGNFWDNVDSVDSYTLGGKTFHKLDRKPFEPTYINQYVLDEESDFTARVETLSDDSITLRDLGRERLMHRKVWDIMPKNIYQAMALDALLDPEIDLVILTGAAGSGKTLLAMAAALDQTIERKMFDKIIVTRNTPDIGESIGFLPGSEEEKMMPWLAAITDTLEALHKHDHCTEGSLKYICDKANIQFKSINFMRGRSIQNAFVLLDECQNLTASQIKTIITRCGEGTKIVCSGNLAQIDSHYLTPVTSGLTYMVERFKNFEGSANIHLNGVVRSRLAEFAEENL